MTIILWIAVGIMLASIARLGKSKKIIREILEQEKKNHSSLVQGYEVLLFFFAIAYIIYIFVHKDNEQSLELVVTSILFWGSIFVYITMYFLSTIINVLLKVKLNQLDGLTGLLNKDAFKRLVENALKNTDKACALIVIDLDNFKQVNDKYGHMEGDDVIKKTAKIIRDNIRAEDFVGRFGGDEFVVFLKENSMEETARIAETINRLVRCYCQLYDTPLELGVSIGVAHHSGNKEVTYDTLFKLADQAMYLSKHKEKNCTTVINVD